MRRSLAALAFLLLSILSGPAKLLPLTVKDITLMLRTGYSSEDVTQELARRRFADTLNSATETDLLKAGATPVLVSSIKSGSFSVSPEEATQAKAKIEAEAKRRVELAEEARKFDTLYQHQLAREKAAALLKFQADNVTYDYLKGSLVRLSNNSFVRADDDAIGKKKYIVYYFSAHWCPPCRRFTPQLVEYYNRVAPQHPEFEIVFYSFDKSATEMENYMRESNMPWPALDYGKRDEKSELLKAAGSGIPSLVLVEASGKLISSSFDGQKYLGPEKVLSDLDGIFAGKQPDALAARR